MKPSPAFKTQLCRHWEAGSCSRGTSCSFAHGREELRANPLHKTQLCQFWEAGLCAHGDACRYAHGLREQKDRMAVLAAPPPPPPPTARPARLQPSMGLQPVQGTAALAMGLRPVQDTAAPAAPANYKTKLCRHWQAGACPRGAACWFAHGPAEQQIYSLPPAIHVPPPVLVPPPVHMPPSALRPTRAAVLGLPAVSAIRDSTAGRSKAGQGAPAPISAHGSYKTQICRNWLAGACLFGAKCSFAHGRQEQRPKMVPAPTVLPPSRQNSGGGSGSSGIYTARPGPKQVAQNGSPRSVCHVKVKKQAAPSTTAAPSQQQERQQEQLQPSSTSGALVLRPSQGPAARVPPQTLMLMGAALLAAGAAMSSAAKPEAPALSWDVMQPKDWTGAGQTGLGTLPAALPAAELSSSGKAGGRALMRVALPAMPAATWEGSLWAGAFNSSTVGGSSGESGGW